MKFAWCIDNRSYAGNAVGFLEIVSFCETGMQVNYRFVAAFGTVFPQ
jgi:hypothetical protein